MLRYLIMKILLKYFTEFVMIFLIFIKLLKVFMKLNIKNMLDLTMVEIFGMKT